MDGSGPSLRKPNYTVKASLKRSRPAATCKPG